MVGEFPSENGFLCQPIKWNGPWLLQASLLLLLEVVQVLVVLVLPGTLCNGRHIIPVCIP